MEIKQIITFHPGKHYKRPRSVNSSCNLFCLYPQEEITISGNELKIINLQTKVILPPNISAHIWLLLLFETNRVYIQKNDIVDSGG